MSGDSRKGLRRRVRVEIDLGALVRNYAKIVAHVRPMRVLCVLKANAYGLGVGPYAEALAKAGCRDFGVAEPFEALELLAVLKRVGCAADVQILSSILPDEIAPMVKAGIILPVTDLATAKLISDARLLRHVLRRNQQQTEEGRRKADYYGAGLQELLARVDSLGL